MKISNLKKHIFSIVTPQFKRRAKNFIGRSLWIISPSYRSNLRVENQIKLVLESDAVHKQRFSEFQNQLAELRNQVVEYKQLVNSNQAFHADSVLFTIKKQSEFSDNVIRGISKVEGEIESIKNEIQCNVLQVNEKIELINLANVQFKNDFFIVKEKLGLLGFENRPYHSLKAGISIFETCNGDEIRVNKLQERKFMEHDCSLGVFLEKMNAKIIKTNILLDIGCGIKPFQGFIPRVHICVEPFEQYREVVLPYFRNNTYFIFLKTKALEGLVALDDNSVDSVVMFDVIEHMDKDVGMNLINEIDRVCKYQMVIMTPLGFLAQHEHDSNDEKDNWGLNGIEYQRHLSGWDPKDFKGKGWEFDVCKDGIEYDLDGKQKTHDMLMAIKTKPFDGFRKSPLTPAFIKSQELN